MFTINRKTILALAAVTALGSVALVSTDASAKPPGSYPGGGIKYGGGVKGGGVKYPSFKPGGFHKPHFVHHHHRPHWRWRYGLRRHYWVAPVVTTAVATRYVSQPTWNRCNCLTKEYTPEGAVVFKDLCTQEMAMNPPVSAPAPAAYDPSQAPTIQGGVPMQQQMAMPAQLPGLQAR